jgi:hypothetical protein
LSMARFIIEASNGLRNNSGKTVTISMRIIIFFGCKNSFFILDSSVDLATNLNCMIKRRSHLVFLEKKYFCLSILKIGVSFDFKEELGCSRFLILNSKL